MTVLRVFWNRAESICLSAARADSPDTETICGLGNRKNQLFNDHLQTHGVESYEVAVEFLHLLKENGADFVVNTFAEFTVEGQRLAQERSMNELAPALESMEEIRGLLTGKRPFVALDYDGTLTPIVERPELAILSADMRGTVTALANRCTVAVISGRDLEDVKGLVDIDSLFYAGSHGFDISGPAGRRIDSQQGAEFLPFYIGDDITDEDAFRVLQGCGVGVVVKDDESAEPPRRSAAQYALDDCRQVRKFLETLTEMLQGE